MISEINIGGKLVGDGKPVFIIAEVGINHDGDVKKAMQLIDAAADAGADCIKFQTHLTEKEMLAGAITADYIGEPIFDLIKRMELSKKDHLELMKHAKEKKIIFLSTAYCVEAADLIDELGLPAFKVGSGELTNLPLIEHIAKKGKPMIVSTGMSELDEIKTTVDLIRKYNNKLILLQCTSLYPPRYEDVNLGMIKKLRETFDVLVGHSDHSEGIYTALGAATLGACCIEKHFTISRDWPGPDQKASIEPNELKELVKGIRAIEKASGIAKKVLEGEKQVQAFARESVVSIKDIPADTTIAKDMVWVKRPGTGIPAKRLPEIIGRKTTKKIPKNTLVKWEDLK